MAYRHTLVTTAHKWLNLSDSTIGLYNHNDCLATALLARKAPAILSAHSNLDFYEREVRPLIPAAISMQLRGLPVDLERRREKRESLRTVRDECDATISDFAASYGLDSFNANSPPQRADLLYARCGFRPRSKNGSVTTDQDALLSIWRTLKPKQETLRPLLEALLHRSRIQTILSRYLNFALDPDGKVRPTAKLFGAKTMRYAYEDPPMQQWVREIRDIIAAPPGYVIQTFDYSALEARLLAYQFEDSRDIECFEKGWDIHLVTANDLFKLSLVPTGDFSSWGRARWKEEKDTHEERRTASKNYRYGKAYGGSAATMKTRTFCPCERWGCSKDLPPTLSRDLMVRAEFEWNIQHRDYESRVESVISSVRKTRTYRSPFGFTRYFPKPFGTSTSPSEGERELRNFFGQHPAAVIINRAQVRAEAAGLSIILQMHDALSILSREEEAESDRARMLEIMQTPVPELGNLVIPVDVKSGERWQ